MVRWSGSCGDEWVGTKYLPVWSVQTPRRKIVWLPYLFTYLFLPPALNPKSYGRARVLEAPSRPILALVGFREVSIIILQYIFVFICTYHVCLGKRLTFDYYKTTSTCSL